MKLGLGTVQFGLTYGINNSTGKPGLRQISDMLTVASKSGIKILDTAADYGDSETNLGKVLAPDSGFKIVTKISKQGSIRESVTSSLSRLNSSSVYALLLHDFQQYHSDPKVWDVMAALKQEGLCEKIGFSLYLPSQLESILDLHPHLDILQIPYSIFDQRFEKYFPQLKSLGVEIHVRSVFVQGLVFREPESLHTFFTPVKSKLVELNEMSKHSGKSVESLCLNFVNANQHIDTIIVGVDTLENLQRNVMVLQEGITDSEFASLRSLEENNEQIILPYNWKLK